MEQCVYAMEKRARGQQMLGYSGYTEHSDYYIAPHDTWESAFEFLKQLACESGDDEFCIGEVHQTSVLEFGNIKWYKWNEDKGEWEHER